MTIIYQYRVATTSLGGFVKLLQAWKGSVYKLVYKELLIYVSLYAFVSLIYRLALNEDQKREFETVVRELHRVKTVIPLSFLLGFYVNYIAVRWWQQFTNVPWPDRTLFTMVAYLYGVDERARIMRRSVARYMLFALIWICRGISVTVMKRFPTLDHIVEAGFITKEEKAVFETVECKYQKFFVPMMWANQILVTARKEGKIDSDFGLRMVLEPLCDFRDKLSLCFVYDWITIPLVYTQVVTFAVYSYFVVCLFSEQYLDPSMNYDGFKADFYVPGFSIMQFLFYMGWLKVAEQMLNPFGEDDDDFDINWLLDRHTTVAFTLVDKIFGSHPEFVKDGFWNDPTPDVPYTESSTRSIRPMFLGSTFHIAPPPPQDTERRFLPEPGDVDQHQWVSRPRARSTTTDSLLSLLHLRSPRHQGSAGSQSSLTSIESGHRHNQGHRMSNGRAYYEVEKDNAGHMRRSSIDIVPLRQRAHTDMDFRNTDLKGRKMSLPFSIHLFKNKQRKMDTITPIGSPKISRFLVETVKEETTPSSDSSNSVKPRRSSHGGSSFQNVVSRTPALSVIAEGNTVTSIKQLTNPRAADHSDEDDEDTFAETQESVMQSDVDDDRAYEDCLSFTEESHPTAVSEDSPSSRSAHYKKSEPGLTPTLQRTLTGNVVLLLTIAESSHSSPTTSRDTRSSSSSGSRESSMASSDDSPTKLLLPSSQKLHKKDGTETAKAYKTTSSSEKANNSAELAPLISKDEC